MCLRDGAFRGVCEIARYSFFSGNPQFSFIKGGSRNRVLELLCPGFFKLVKKSWEGLKLFEVPCVVAGCD